MTVRNVESPRKQTVFGRLRGTASVLVRPLVRYGFCFGSAACAVRLLFWFGCFSRGETASRRVRGTASVDIIRLSLRLFV